MPSLIISAGKLLCMLLLHLQYDTYQSAWRQTMPHLFIPKPSMVLGKSRCLINVYITDEWMHGWMHEWIAILSVNLKQTMRCSKKETIKQNFMQSSIWAQRWKQFYLSGWGCQESSHRSERNEEACVRWREP